MRAAVLRAYGEPPEIGDFDEPSGTVVTVSAAGLNPIDLRLASGTLARRPPLPSVVGSEGIGLLDGRRVYFDMAVPPFGAFAERCAIEPSGAVQVPDGLEDGHALCYGIAGLAAWLSLERRARVQPGERVLVLGASGTVGLIAVQAAKLLGAERVVAAARSEPGLERARERGADATVSLATGAEAPGGAAPPTAAAPPGAAAPDEIARLAAAFREAAEGDLDVVIDPLWGIPAAAAVEALGFRGRLVQLGQSAAATAELSSVSIRFRELEILGHTNFAAPPEVRRAALERMFAHAAAGELVADYELLPLADIAQAWERQAASPNVKLVLTP